MSRRTIDYSIRFTKQRDAAFDFVSWLGFRRSLILARLARKRDLEDFSNWAGFCGVSGYPVRAAFSRWTKQSID
jgi:hypothetical protein